MVTGATLPGLRFQARHRREPLSPLRSDVAGFLGVTRRGPVGVPVRVDGWREFAATFGGLEDAPDLHSAVFGYFENGGEVAFVVRVESAEVEVARAEWSPGTELSRGARSGAAYGPAFDYERYRFEATSPGAWGGGVRVAVEFERDGVDGEPRLALVVSAPGEPGETIVDLLPSSRGYGPDGRPVVSLAEQVAAASALVRLHSVGPRSAPLDQRGPRARAWSGRDTVALVYDAPQARTDAERAEDLLRAYRAAVAALEEVPEVAIVAAPALHLDLRAVDPDERRRLQGEMLAGAAALQDRIVLVDPPSPREPGGSAGPGLSAYLTQLRELDLRPVDLRAGAMYHPWVSVRDVSTGARASTRAIAPSGHVAGLIAELDRSRGAHHTPAGVALRDVATVAEEDPRGVQAELYPAGVNPLVCRANRGVLVWGGRTLDRSPDGRFLAHRRLVHRLVRSIRRVAEPLVFEVNGPRLWSALIRSVNAVLVEAFRRGALKGERPDEAFRVRCDEATTPASDRASGRVLCEVDIAPAAPMEFITLRVAVARAGELEVFER